MVTISINKNDILKSIYFITAIIQKQTSGSMQGALSSKGDLMGGIFDRWINTVPESIIFNKIILPEVRNGQSSEIISDFYLYDPKTAGIAPDVIGIRTPNGTIPFAVFNDRWIPVENMPQIEVKTFKKPQKMISLRNQDYDGKYLVMAESELRIDYLLPFFDASIFQDSIHSNLVMDDDTFIVSNSAGRLQGIDIVNINDDEIGTVTLLKITTAEAFMNSATFCEGTVSVQYINGVEKKQESLPVPLKKSHYQNTATEQELVYTDFQISGMRDIQPKTYHIIQKIHAVGHQMHSCIEHWIFMWTILIQYA